MSAEANDGGAENKKKGKYRKDKPWDDPSVDHWKIEPVTPDEGLPPPLEESSFATLFPKYREKYIRQIWPLVTTTLKGRGIGCELNLLEGSMMVKTTRKTWDPYVIMKARDLIKLLSRSIPVQQAIKILNDDMYCDVIKIKNMVRNKERFVKRRQRLVGPNGCTLKALELVTNCYIFVQGNTVSVMGSIIGLKQVREVVEQCMKNVHPIYNIKKLMIKKELMANPDMQDQNWERFLPKFTKKNVKSKKPFKIGKKKDSDRTPFPPAPTPRKVDLELESGEYFMKEEERKRIKNAAKRSKNAQAKQEKKAARQAEFVPPTESSNEGQKKNKRSRESSSSGDSEVKRMADSLKAAKKAKTSKQAPDASSFLM